jgi:hypothetical protein
MVNHILTDIFAHAKMGAAGGLRGGISLATFNKAHYKKQIQAEKIKTIMFSSLFFLSDFPCNHFHNLLAILPNQS